MSGVISSVGKVFRRVAKVAKKVLPIALAVGAVVFTAGAMMGQLPSWGTAVSGFMGKLGLDASGMLGRTLIGAVTQAGYGAVLGAGTSLVTGGKIENGLLMGAAGGAVTGGITGAAGWNTDPLSGLNKPPAAAPEGFSLGGGASPQLAAAAPPSQASQFLDGPLNTPASTSVTGPAPAAAAPEGYNLGGAWQTPSLAAAPPPAPPPSGGGGGGTGTGGDDNGLLSGLFGKNGGLGYAIGGLGTGISNYAAAASKERADKERARLIADNYRVTGRTGPDGQPLPNGLLVGASAPASTPTNAPRRFDPNAFNGEYRFDPASGRLQWVPNESATA